MFYARRSTFRTPIDKDLGRTLSSASQNARFQDGELSLRFTGITTKRENTEEAWLKMIQEILALILLKEKQAQITLM